MSIFGVILVRIFSHSAWIRRDLYSVRMRENADQNNIDYGHFSRSDFLGSRNFLYLFRIFRNICMSITITLINTFWLWYKFWTFLKLFWCYCNSCCWYYYAIIHTIPKFYLIFWCRNFVEIYSFHSTKLCGISVFLQGDQQMWLLRSCSTGLQVPTLIIIVYNFTNFTTTFSEMTKKLILSEQLLYNWNIAIVTII